MKKLFLMAILAVIVAGVSSCNKKSSDLLVSTTWKWSDDVDEDCGEMFFFFSPGSVIVTTYGYTGENESRNGSVTIPYRYDRSGISIAYGGWGETEMIMSGTVSFDTNTMTFEERGRVYYKQIIERQ